MNFKEQLKAIIPGKTYPSRVVVIEDGHEIEFSLNSFRVGMYCAIHIDGKLATQAGDHNNKTFATSLKKDIKAAIGRGSTVLIGNIQTISV